MEGKNECQEKNIQNSDDLLQVLRDRKESAGAKKRGLTVARIYSV